MQGGVLVIKVMKRSIRSAKPTPPAKPTSSVKPADRRLAQSHRLPIWRRGTLVLMACVGMALTAMACTNPGSTPVAPGVTTVPGATTAPGATSPGTEPTLAY
jgi:hypothetical protein